ncbi:MAG: DnaA regulatory inactivator Hda [Acinetobacter sp.]|nr:DnaA regulatory inactivator Hda [Acinetobacter sp.]
MRQLQLDIAPRLDAQISDFSGPSWEGVIDGVRQLHTDLISRLYIYGDAGSGKTHLLSAICDSYTEAHRTAIRVPLLDLLDTPTEAIAALEHFDLVALDDIEAVIGVPHWQKAIFNLINLSKHEGGQLVFSSRFAPKELRLELPDLHSRLMQAVSVQLPDGRLYADRKSLIDSTLERRGVHLPAEIIEYLLHNGPHQAALLLQCLDQLEQLLKGNKTKMNAATLKQIFVFIKEYQTQQSNHTTDV